MKLLEKFLTRDAPLIAIECWYKGRVKNFKNFFEIPFPKTLFLFRNGAFEFYTDLKDFDDRLPRRLAKWLKNKVNQRKVYLVHGYMKNGLGYFKKIKAAKNTSTKELLNHLSKVMNLFARGFLGVLVTHHFPRWQDEFNKQGKILFHQNLADEIMKWREAEGNIFFNEGVETFYLLLKKIARRKKWDSRLLKYITFKELYENIKHGRPLPLKNIRKRKNTSFIYFDYRIIYEPKINKTLKTYGFDLRKEAASTKVREIKGTTANTGYAKGKIKIVFNREQLTFVKKGDILVAPMTSPWYLPAMKKASGIVTDEGGLSCHAAIIAREFKIPCIVGTEIATKVFKDGDFVEVDANKGIVRKIK